MEETNTTAPITTQNYAIPFAIVIAGLAIAGAIYFGDGKQEAVAAQPSGTVDPVTKDDHIIGNPNAKVIIVEYSDPECPYCKTFHVTMNRIMREYGKDGEVAWVYRQFPIESLHPVKAQNEAEATECANKLGGNTKFWEYINQVFEITPSNNKLDQAELPKIAKSIGLNVTEFNKCLESDEMKTVVDAHIASGAKAGVSGTPYSIILVNKKAASGINGAQPYEVVKAQIDELLK
ncbi:MAG: disulfide bond formation protein DsbA [Candidatus Yonathbacteria bacterium CG10_big_fil_rev_8_21_14_0_10_43_136]|uniref:Disulfide bond formation protein DsbA n=1 Tax=Candidatus Yonathbacteria bacterium CG_4_10_14_0_8_um_filter_43_17 TaxID=1975099 RepID=A0A2M7Q6P4_9BACT|nr:MAG: disulfide bond formation protein DsbA [Candidatus Yonathbacteria bacterium CG17_big_fil_post_rev_8_21_14_2_50_43_9]PIR40589.1 MAG: disulfide bond formation protein DsbA [Candidatus Yonathbacteria bacterium CG10_big_fil_rev_8_21_14_0_10_43_136]PIX57444.1 MAG: disulfide bond formation protein DsbA [Candidatus Yonathbacteria bacterium CG_4_10_14_3_um_filter_43_12]PIY58745.1 MAG: disulfide bond formation protein DsbA [Candidatus Yonathbacteria bacterium CG_4_10_14_0_8_um_filter_43_17]PJC216